MLDRTSFALLATFPASFKMNALLLISLASLAVTAVGDICVAPARFTGVVQVFNNLYRSAVDTERGFFKLDPIGGSDVREWYMDLQKGWAYAIGGEECWYDDESYQIVKQLSFNVPDNATEAEVPTTADNSTMDFNGATLATYRIDVDNVYTQHLTVDQNCYPRVNYVTDRSHVRGYRVIWYDVQPSTEEIQVPDSLDDCFNINDFNLTYRRENFDEVF